MGNFILIPEWILVNKMLWNYINALRYTGPDARPSFCRKFITSDRIPPEMTTRYLTANNWHQRKKKQKLKGNFILMSVSHIWHDVHKPFCVPDIVRLTACHKTAYNKTASSPWFTLSPDYRNMIFNLYWSVCVGSVRKRPRNLLTARTKRTNVHIPTGFHLLFLYWHNLSSELVTNGKYYEGRTESHEEQFFVK